MNVEKLSIAILIASVVALQAQDVLSEFSNGSDGWVTVGHVRSAGPLPESGITARDMSPPVSNGFLLVQDLDNSWNWMAAPSNFLGDWRHFAEVRIGVVTDDFVTVHPLVLFLSGTHDGTTTNSAYLEYPIEGIPASSRLDITASLDETRWTMLSGNWTNLLKSIQQFWIRMDLNDNVASEVDLIDYVKLVDSTNLELRAFRAVELEFFSAAGVTNQLEISDDSVRWRNYGLPFVGDGRQQTKSVRIGDQLNAYFRIRRIQ